MTKICNQYVDMIHTCEKKKKTSQKFYDLKDSYALVEA